MHVNLDQEIILHQEFARFRVYEGLPIHTKESMPFQVHTTEACLSSQKFAASPTTRTTSNTFFSSFSLACFVFTGHRTGAVWVSLLSSHFLASRGALVYQV
jgi:hypothetical protein